MIKKIWTIFFEFLGFQEALKNSQNEKSKDTLDDIFNSEMMIMMRKIISFKNYQITK